jgi:aryl sulfotransferase
MARSGNLWLYRLVEGAFRHSGMSYRGFILKEPIHEYAKKWPLSFPGQEDVDVLDVEAKKCFYRISSIFRMPIEDIDAYVQRCSHVWTHSEFCELCLTVFPKFSRIIYIIRDPRDVAVSMARFAFTPYMKKHFPHSETTPRMFLEQRFDIMMHSWTKHVGGYLKYRDELDIHVIFYERLVHSFNSEIAKLLDYLEVDLDKRGIEQIRNEASFLNMEAESPCHVWQGKAFGWVEALPTKLRKRGIRISGPMLSLLNYPVSEDQVNGSLPSVPRQLSRTTIEKAIKCGRRQMAVETIKKRCASTIYRKIHFFRA